MSPKETLGDAFKACYYARDPVMLNQLVKQAEALEEAVKQYRAFHQTDVLKPGSTQLGT